MVIYSDVLTTSDLHRTTVNGLYIDDITPIKNPKVRKRGWKLHTASTTGTRWKNSGTHGAERIEAGTWDDHGFWFANLYAIDPNARIARYQNADDFHAKTNNKYKAPAEATA